VTLPVTIYRQVVYDALIVVVSTCFYLEGKMYTEEIDRQTHWYASLVRGGIFVHRLRGTYHPLGQSWTLEVSLLGGVTKYQAKEHLENYLKAVYRAEGITFLTRRSQPEHQFYVQFFRGDL
jgi:hypothetical protein